MSRATDILVNPTTVTDIGMTYNGVEWINSKTMAEYLDINLTCFYSKLTVSKNRSPMSSSTPLETGSTSLYHYIRKYRVKNNNIWYIPAILWDEYNDYYHECNDFRYAIANAVEEYISSIVDHLDIYKHDAVILAASALNTNVTQIYKLISTNNTMLMSLVNSIKTYELLRNVKYDSVLDMLPKKAPTPCFVTSKDYTPYTLSESSTSVRLLEPNVWEVVVNNVPVKYINIHKLAELTNVHRCTLSTRLNNLRMRRQMDIGNLDIAKGTPQFARFLDRSKMSINNFHLFPLEECLKFINDSNVYIGIIQLVANAVRHIIGTNQVSINKLSIHAKVPDYIIRRIVNGHTSNIGNTITLYRHIRANKYDTGIYKLNIKLPVNEHIPL